MSNNQQGSRSTRGGMRLPAVILVMLLTIAGTLYMARLLFSHVDVASQSAETPVGSTQTPLPSPTPAIRAEAVTQQIQRLQKLVTTTYHMQVVVERSEEYPSSLGTKDTVVLIAGGTVVAGVDLSKITVSDVQVLDEGVRVKVQLPPVEIFSFTGLDEEKTRVYRHDTPFGFKPIDDIETRARQDAKAEIIRVACKDGIMDTTTKEARDAVERFLISVGVGEPQVIAAPTPACPVTVEPTPTPKP